MASFTDGFFETTDKILGRVSEGFGIFSSIKRQDREQELEELQLASELQQAQANLERERAAAKRQELLGRVIIFFSVAASIATVFSVIISLFKTRAKA